MPKKDNKETPAVQVENPNVAPTEAAPVAESTVETPAVQEPVIKKVRIMTILDIDCLICGQRYDYPAQKMVEVPEDVAQILVFGKKAYRM